MRMTAPCVSSGSLWDPNITAETLEAQQLRVSLTLWNESTPYQVLLTSFPHTENQSCFHHVLMVPEPTPKEFHQRANVTLTLSDWNWCCRHRVQVQPFFSSCLNDCLRHSVTLPCPEIPDAPGRKCMAALGVGVTEGQHLELNPDLVLRVGADFNFTWTYSGLQGGAVETLLG
uniref:Uncharacterized protein n=1 Tax=Ursus americanus TaxID=9643 RepID=A0A452QP96_URSAM